MDEGVQITVLEGPDTNVVFEPLYPFRSEETTNVMQGGTALRYFCLKTLKGQELEGAEIRYYCTVTDKEYRTTSGKGGEVVFSFKVDQNPGSYRCALVIDSIKKDGEIYRTRGALRYPLKILPLTYGTNWTIGCGSSAKAGFPIAALGPLSVSLAAMFSQNGGMLVSRTKQDPDRDGQDSLGINNFARIGIGKEISLGFEDSAKLGTIKVEAPQASLGLEQILFQEITTLFPPPANSSTREKWMEGFSLLTGISNLVESGVIPGGAAVSQVISVILNALMAAISENVQVKELLQGIELKLSPEVNAFQLGLETKAGNIKGLKLLNFSSEIAVESAFNYYAVENEIGAKITVSSEVSFSLADLVGFSLGELNPGISSISLEVRVNPSQKRWTRAIITLGQPPDDRGEIQALEFTISREVLGNAADQLEQLTHFSGSSDQEGEFTITPSMVADLFHAVVHALSRVTIPYRWIVTMDKEPTEVELGLGLEVEGAQIELGITPKFGRYQNFTLEEGVFVPLDAQLHLGRLVPYSTYDTRLYEDQVDTLPSMVQELLKAVGETLVNAWDMVSGILSNISDLALELGGDIWGGGQIIFQKGTSLLSGLSQEGVVLASNKIQTAARKEEINFGRIKVEDHPFIVGSLYFLQPEGKTLSKPAKLLLSYSAESLKGKSPDSLGMYWLNPQSGSWEPLTGAAHDKEARTFTATITHTGKYCLGSDPNPPEFFSIMDLQGKEIEPLPDLTIYIEEDGSGIDPHSLNLLLDEKSLPFKLKGNSITPSLAQPLADGPHRLEISGEDRAGNRGQAFFSFKTFHPLGAPLLQIQEGNEGVKLSWTPGKPGTYPLEKWVIKRALPEAGSIFHPLVELDDKATAFLDRDVKPGETYAYFIQGLDSGGHYSYPSQMVRVKIPGQLQTPTPAPSQTPNPSETTTVPPSPTQSPTSQLQQGEKGIAIWVPLLIIGILLVAVISIYLLFRRKK